MIAVFQLVLFLAGCVTVEENYGISSNQPPFRIDKVEKKLDRTNKGNILKLRFVGEILQEGWEIDGNKLDSYSFALKFPVGNRIDERKNVAQWFLQFKPVFYRKKGSPRGKSFDEEYNVPLSEKDVKNCVIQLIRDGDITEDFLLYYKGRYYPEGKPYKGELPAENSNIKKPDWAKPPSSREYQDGLDVDKKKNAWGSGVKKNRLDN
jgi:hypothetical protein